MTIAAGLELVAIAHRPHHAAHMRPVASRLGYEGDMKPRAPGPDSVALVASYGDLAKARRLGYRRIVLMQHGAGQSYGGDPRTARHPAYAGGDDNDDVGLFLVPNEHAAGRWRERYPAARVAVVGCPRLAALPARVGLGVAAAGGDAPVVAISFHWNYHGIPEMRSAFDWYRNAVAELPRRFRVIGHAHPKRRDLAAWYAAHGIEYVPDFDEVCRRADVYVCDNSSSLFEFASTGRPVVVLNAPWYRRAARHGLRFWEASGVGINVNEPEALAAGIELAADDSAALHLRREVALGVVYGVRDSSSAALAVHAIRQYASAA